MDRKQMRRCKDETGYLVRLCVAFLCCFLFAVIGSASERPIMTYAQESADLSEVLSYEHLGGGQIAITGIKDSSVRVLKMPDKVDGYTVTKIADSAFMDNATLVSVEIPDTVTEIGSYAFWNCQSLMNLKVPTSVTVIGYGAFGWAGRVEALTVDTEKGSVAEGFAKEHGIVLRSELMNYLESDTARYGMWKLTYKEFIEMYRSIGTENDLFLKMLKEKGPRHTDSTIWFDYDGVSGIEIEFEDVLTEKIYALHYAPFEYNSEDFESGNWGKDCMEAYLDHGGVCGILSGVYRHFICTILEEYDWQYQSYANDEVNHQVLIIMTEDGRCFQADNCGVDYWWLGLEVTPDYDKIGEYEVDPQARENFFLWRENFNSLEKCYWYTFGCYVREKLRPVWYNYKTADWDMYLGYETPKYYKCTYRGIDEVISMAGNTRLEGYAKIADLGFDMSVGGHRPRCVKVTNGDGQVTISWDAVEGATKYTISRYENGAYTVLAGDITDTQYTVTGLTNWESYEFLVQAYVNGEWSLKSVSNHVNGIPKDVVPTEDENFYYKQSGYDQVNVIGLKNMEAKSLDIPQNVNGYQVVGVSTEVLIASSKMEHIIVPEGVSLKIVFDDFSSITTKVITKDEKLLATCVNLGIPCAYYSERPMFSVTAMSNQSLTVNWYELFGASQYRVCIWKEDDLVRLEEVNAEHRVAWIFGLEIGTAYRVVVQAKVDGDWLDYPEEDVQTVMTWFEDELFSYRLNEDGSYSLMGWNNQEVKEVLYCPEQYCGKTITGIGDGAFVWNENIIKIILPFGIREIEGSFYACSKLEYVALSPNVVTIHGNAFRECSSLKKIYLPESVENIDWYAFDTDIVIYAPEGSAAATFAEEKGLGYVAFDGIPQNVLVTEKDQALSICWNAVEFADSYAVTVWNTDGAVVVQESGITDTAYVADGLQNGKEYRICVRSEIGSIVSKIKEEEIISASPYSISELNAFVSRFYELILERPADPSGLAEWTGWLKDGTFTGAEAAAGFIMSDEFMSKEMSNEDFVKILYRAFFGREADPSGLATWTGFLEQGYIKKYVFAGFANSDEFGTLCSSYGITRGNYRITLAEQTLGLSEREYNVWQFVDRIYYAVLGRGADPGGLSTWATVLLDGSWDGATVAKGFLLSDEFLNKNMSNEEYVKVLYRAFFGREADPGGLAVWTDALANGFTKEFVFAGFANSDEFGILCDSYGITQGEVPVV